MRSLERGTRRGMFAMGTIESNPWSNHSTNDMVTVKHDRPHLAFERNGFSKTYFIVVTTAFFAFPLP